MQFSTIPRQTKKAHKKAPESAGLEEFGKNSASQLSNITFNIDLSLPNNVTNNNYMTDNDESTYCDESYIPFERLKLSTVIGKGEFAVVYKGYYMNSNNELVNVAIKTLHNHIDANKEAFLCEAKVMMKLNHHCIVKFIGLSMGSHLLMVQELVPLGSMLSYLIRCKDKVNPDYELKIWAAQIACGKYLLIIFTVHI